MIDRLISWRRLQQALLCWFLQQISLEILSEPSSNPVQAPAYHSAAIFSLYETNLLAKLGVSLGACVISLRTQKKHKVEAIALRNASCYEPGF